MLPISRGVLLLLQSAASGTGWKEKIAGLVGFAVMFGLMRLPASSLALKVLAGAVAGLLIGFIPYTQAKKRGANAIAVVSLVACVAAGSIGGLIVAIPVCILLTLFVRQLA